MAGLDEKPGPWRMKSSKCPMNPKSTRFAQLDWGVLLFGERREVGLDNRSHAILVWNWTEHGIQRIARRVHYQRHRKLQGFWRGEILKTLHVENAQSMYACTYTAQSYHIQSWSLMRW